MGNIFSLIFCVLNEEMGSEYKTVLPYCCILSVEKKLTQVVKTKDAINTFFSSTDHAIKDHFNDFKWQAKRAQF